MPNVTPFQIGIELVGDLAAFADGRGQAVRRGAMRAAERMRARAKLEIRRDTRAALGDRAANTWRDEIFPTGSRQSWHPTVMLWSKWPIVVDAFTRGATITPKNGIVLAIPTNNVPSHGRRPMTPVEVEAAFNQDLIVRPSHNNPSILLAFVNAIPARSGRGYRPPTKRRVGQGRAVRLILMFVFVRQVSLRPIIHYPAIRDQLAPVWLDYLASEIAAEVAA